MATKYDHDNPRDIRIIKQGMDPPSSRWSDMVCPFCGHISRAYHWSLAGGGKKCENRACGAKFDITAQAVPVLKGPKK